MDYIKLLTYWYMQTYKKTSDDITKLILSEDFWIKCQLYVNINQPVYHLLRLLDGSSPVIGKIYYQMFGIQEKIKAFTGISASQRSEIYQCFVYR